MEKTKQEYKILAIKDEVSNDGNYSHRMGSITWREVRNITNSTLTDYIMEIAKKYAKQESVAFLESIRDYERENGERICFDERTSDELYEEFNKRNG